MEKALAPPTYENRTSTDPPEYESCGGFGGIPCPGLQECVDDPSDDCDPENGGADCGGICVPVQTDTAD